MAYVEDDQLGAWGLQDVAGGVELGVEAYPRMARNAVLSNGTPGRTHVHLTATQQVDDALCQLIAGVMNVPRARVTLKQGRGARVKLLHIAGLNAGQAVGRLHLRVSHDKQEGTNEPR